MYSNDNGKTWIKSEIDHIRDYLKDNGFIFPQSEFCIKNNLRIELDCEPYLIYKRNWKGSKEFTTLEELKRIIIDHIEKK